MSNHPHKKPPTHTEEELKSLMIERHEDGSECRKCTNCACMNNKLSKIGLDNPEIGHKELNAETFIVIDPVK